MTTTTRTARERTAASRDHAGLAAARDRARRRALYITTVITIGSLVLLGDLLLVNHTNGKELVGPATAAGGVVVGLLSLAYLAHRSRSKAARFTLYTLWAGIAFLGLMGFNSHRAPVTAASVDQRQRPPLAPLVFTSLGVAGVVVLRSGTKSQKGS